VKSWPPKLDPALFVTAAAVMDTWQRAGDLEYHCCLKAIASAGSRQAHWVDVHYSRAFFTYFFRPANQDSSSPWWSKGDYESRKTALCFAAAMAADNVTAR